MGHSIYNTEGIILSSFDVGEANKFFRIFTRDLGFIEATAQGVRKIESKNRYGLQDFSVSYFSLVRGKDIWRITNVDSRENLYFLFRKDKNKLNFLIKTFGLLKQFIHGEEKNEELFEIIFETVEFLKNNELSRLEFENLELFTKMKILHNLGYFDNEENIDLLEKNFLTKDLISKIELLKEKITQKINKSLEDSHLL